MIIKDQILSIEQAQRLHELGVDVAKFSRVYWGWLKLVGRDAELSPILGRPEHPFLLKGGEIVSGIPTLTVADILDYLPERIINDNKDYQLEVRRYDGDWYVTYLRTKADGDLDIIIENIDEHLITALYYVLIEVILHWDDAHINNEELSKGNEDIF